MCRLSWETLVLKHLLAVIYETVVRLQSDSIPVSK